MHLFFLLASNPQRENAGPRLFLCTYNQPYQTLPTHIKTLHGRSTALVLNSDAKPFDSPSKTPHKTDRPFQKTHKISPLETQRQPN